MIGADVPPINMSPTALTVTDEIFFLEDVAQPDMSKEDSVMNNNTFLKIDS